MGKFKTAAMSVAVLAALGLSTGALLLAWMNRPVPPSTTVIAEKLDKVGGYVPDATRGDRVVKLASAHQGGNASFEWTCGKASPSGARAEDHFGHWNNLGGAVAYNAKAEKILGIEVAFATDSFAADNNTLADTVMNGQQWFDPRFKQAAFVTDILEPRSAENEKDISDKAAKDWTHLIKGKFTLNGISQDLAIPAKVAFQGESARIEADFTISRQTFKVEKRTFSAIGAAGDLAGFIVDDEVRLSAKITASPDLAIMVSELGKQAQVQQMQIKALKEEQNAAIKALTNELIQLRQSLEDAKTGMKKAAAAGPGPVLAPADLASLPKEFEDAVVLPPLEKDYEMPIKGKMTKLHHSYPGMKEPFKMILVPGDPAKGISPFYIGETEVTWNMYKTWSHWGDTTPVDAEHECKILGLRPSNAGSYADTSHAMGYEGTPAFGMSRLAAERFCELLSKSTGRTYRLPTEAEWELAHALGGGDPATDEEKKAAAWCRENASVNEQDNITDPGNNPFAFEPHSHLVKAKKPNKLGLHDMLGNVSEWVKTPGAADADGKNTFVRGGDFLTPLAELTDKRREESDNRRDLKESWNATYPQGQNSLWWYKDHYQVGFRLVCEPVNLPKQ